MQLGPHRGVLNASCGCRGEWSGLPDTHFKISPRPAKHAKRIPPPVKSQEGSCYDLHVLFACVLNAACLSDLVVILFSSGSDVYTGNKFAFFNTEMFEKET